PDRCPRIVAPPSWSGDTMSRSCDTSARSSTPVFPGADLAPVEGPGPRDRGLRGGGRYWDRTSDLFRVRVARYRCANRPWRHRVAPTEVGTGFEPVYTALQAVASPLRQPTRDARASYGTALPTRCRERRSPGADDRIRTGDPHLGKVMLYQLSYVRVTGSEAPVVGDTGIEPVTSS